MKPRLLRPEHLIFQRLADSPITTADTESIISATVLRYISSFDNRNTIFDFAADVVRPGNAPE